MSDSTPPDANTASGVTTPRQRRIAIALLLVGAVCAGMGQTIVFSVLPPLAREIGLSNIQVGFIFMVSASAWVVCGPRWGRMSDQRGRKLFILIGLLGFSISTVLFGASVQLGLAGALSGLPLYVLMIAMRSLYGLIGSASPPAAQAYIADRTSKRDRTAGIASFSAAFGFGAMLGPGFGAATSLLGPTVPFYAVAAIAASMSIAVYFFLPERTGPTKRNLPAKVRLTDPRLLPFFAFALAFGVINAIPIQTIAFYFIDRLGFTTAAATGYVSIGLTAGAVSSLAAQLIVVQRFRLPPATLMRVAPAMMALGQALIFLSDHLWPVVIGMAMSGFGAGLAIPAATSAASLAVNADEQGGAIGLAGSAGASGFILSPLLGFTLYDVSPAAPFMFTSAAALALLCYAWISRKIGGAVPPQADDVPEEALSDPATAPYQ
ncbi:MFS transporter [Hyphococcus sp.]|uniref:MFS transporter n=1 Tax=Hyphococcus sp. TaxID=2038636 RepID=UPI002087B7E4|nr:MAG: MFS transporter [Marinicaulis sp.]